MVQLGTGMARYLSWWAGASYRASLSDWPPVPGNGVEMGLWFVTRVGFGASHGSDPISALTMALCLVLVRSCSVSSCLSSTRGPVGTDPRAGVFVTVWCQALKRKLHCGCDSQ